MFNRDIFKTIACLVIYVLKIAIQALCIRLSQLGAVLTLALKASRSHKVSYSFEQI